MALSKAQRQQIQERARKGGQALVAKYGRAYMQEIGRRGGPLGGRPTWQQALAKELARNPKATLNGRRQRPGLTRKETGQERAWALAAKATAELQAANNAADPGIVEQP